VVLGAPQLHLRHGWLARSHPESPRCPVSLREILETEGYTDFGGELKLPTFTG
jgi:hypothetical protein